MHIGHTAIFQNPNQVVTDYQIYQEDMVLAKEAADLGFQSVWGIEHHFTDYIMNPNVTQFLAYMAGYNSQIKVGSMVVVMPWYPAIRIAENMAMLDAMSDGRAVFGMGRGLARVEYAGLQINQNESTDRFIESAQAVLTGLEQGYVESDGTFIKQPKARIRPEPFKTFHGRCYAAAVSPSSAPILAELGIGMLIIPQKPFADHLKDVETHAALYRKIHGGEPPSRLSHRMSSATKMPGGPKKWRVNMLPVTGARLFGTMSCSVSISRTSRTTSITSSRLRPTTRTVWSTSSCPCKCMAPPPSATKR